MADGKGTYIDKNTEINVVMLNQRYNNNVDEDLTLYAIWEDTKIPEPEGPKPEHPKPEPEIPWDIIFWGGEGSVTHKEHIAYIIGYPDGTVKPENQITRAEVATIFFRLLDDSARTSLLTKTNTYTDVEADKWYNTAISTLTKANVIAGYEDGSFKPNNFITRAELATLATRFRQLSGESTIKNDFSDIGDHWATYYINQAFENKWI